MSSQTLATEKAPRPYKKDLLIHEQLVTKDFKLKYRRSFLGVLWSGLNPLLMMIVMSIVFSYMFGSNAPNFPLYLIVGNVTFSLMSDSTNAALTSIINAAPLLKKVKVNRYIFPVQKVLFALVNFAFSLIAVAIVMLFFQVMPTWHFIWLPLCLFLLMLFCMDEVCAAYRAQFDSHVRRVRRGGHERAPPLLFHHHALLWRGGLPARCHSMRPCPNVCGLGAHLR